MISAAVIGASGYTGAELVRWLQAHPSVKITALAANSKAGQPMTAVFPHLVMAAHLPDLVTVDALDWSRLDVAFCALPHGTSQTVIAGIPEHVVVIDLSADFRLRSLEEYQRWYGQAHQAPDLQPTAVYGLSEHARDAIRQARLIACPGCYPTSILLPILPLLRAGAIGADWIIADSKSGVTGAGRSLKEGNLFSEVHDGMQAYGVGNHRHISEISQELNQAAKGPVGLDFTPHLVPMNRGIFSTIYAMPSEAMDADGLRELLARYYQDEPFVHVLPKGHQPATRMVRGSNHCLIAVEAAHNPRHVIITSVIDNLVKGASGQAVQNMNIRFGLPETEGLGGLPVFP
jgi:N-acetyl-gamma-glutamyl-phosphate reductase